MFKNLSRAATAVVASTTLVLAGLGATAVQAQPAPSDNTRVVVSPRLANQMGAAGIEPNAVGKAKMFNFGYTVGFKFPISRMTANGTRIFHMGGVNLSTPQASLSLTQLRINLRRNTVSAVVGGDARAILFTVQDASRPALGDERLVFNKLSAGVLNTTFDVKFFKPGGNFAFADLP